MCLFCRIASHEANARVVYEDDEFVAFHDIRPQAPTHVLVIPRKHVQSLDHADEKDEALLGKLLLRTRAIARTLGLAKGGYRVVINTGEDAGQSVPHVHAHLVGGRSLGWPPG